MATTGLTDGGKEVLFSDGWTSKVTTAWLYTDADVLVDTQSITLTHTSSTSTMQVSADITFNVDASTDDVSYIEIGRMVGEMKDPFYTKTLSTLYDFATAGTLTVDSFVITISGTSLLAAGIDSLCNVGLETMISAKLYDAGDVNLDTQALTFTATDTLDLDSSVVFDVAKDKTASYIKLLNSGGFALYKRTLDTTYPFSTAGTLTVDSWSISI